MTVTALRIENFRGVKRLDLDLDLDKLMVLIGENNTGKTAVLDDSRMPSPGGRHTRGRFARTMVRRKRT